MWLALTQISRPLSSTTLIVGRDAPFSFSAVIWLSISTTVLCTLEVLAAVEDDHRVLFVVGHGLAVTLLLSDQLSFACSAEPK